MPIAFSGIHHHPPGTVYRRTCCVVADLGGFDGFEPPFTKSWIRSSCGRNIVARGSVQIWESVIQNIKHKRAANRVDYKGKWVLEAAIWLPCRAEPLPLGETGGPTVSPRGRRSARRVRTDSTRLKGTADVRLYTWTEWNPWIVTELVDKSDAFCLLFTMRELQNQTVLSQCIEAWTWHNYATVFLWITCYF